MNASELLRGLRVVCVAPEGRSFRVLDTFGRFGAETVAISTGDPRAVEQGEMGAYVHAAVTVDLAVPAGRDLLARLVRTTDVLFDWVAFDRTRERMLELDRYRRANPGLVIVSCYSSRERASNIDGIEISGDLTDTSALAVEAALAALWTRDRRNGEGVRLEVRTEPGYGSKPGLENRPEIQSDPGDNSLAVLRAVDYSESEIEHLVRARVLAIGTSGLS